MSIGNLGLLGIDTSARPDSVDIAANAVLQVGFAIGQALLGKKRRKIPSWRFIVWDGGDAEGTQQATRIIEGQLPISNLSDRVSTTWTDLQLPGSARPPSRWTSSENDRIDIELELFAATSAENVDGQIADLKSLVRPDPSLGRPPIVSFNSGNYSFYGAVIEVTVRTRQPRDDGSIRHAEVSVAMKAVGDSPKPMLPTDKGKPSARSRWHVVRRGEDFEQIAKKEYGDPRFGIPLRQDHFDAFPRPGDRVFLSSRSVYQRRMLAPDSFFLSAAPEVVGPWLDLVALRGGTTTVKGS